MKLRIRLILAFFLLSVVPLGAVTLYSYVTNYRALQDAATRETDQLASELSGRMQLVTAQLSDRVEQLMEISAPAPVREVKEESPPTADPEQIATLVQGHAADALGEAAMLLNSVDLRGMRGPGGRGRRGPFPPREGADAGRRGEAEAPGSIPSPTSTQPSTPPALMPAPQMPGGALAATRERPSRSRDESEIDRGGLPPRAPEAPSVGPPRPPSPALPPLPPGTDESDRIHIDVGPIARDVFRQLVPDGTNPSTLTPEQRRQIASEINQRMAGINEGLKLAAAELQRKADEARQKADDDKKAAQKKAAPMKRRSVLSGNKLAVTVEQNGSVVRTANAEINLPNVLMTVFSAMPRAQGEVPFAVASDGRLYTPTMANRAAIEQLAPAKLPDGASLFREWVVVLTKDPTGSGLRLGIARPVGDSLAEVRRTAGRNALLGLGLIGVSLLLIVPLSSRLTRNLSTLTGAVRRIARGDYSTRVALQSKDEIGELAVAFNQMAGDVEAHQRTAVERERLRRELELGRQIQQDMQPQGPLRLGLTEIQGVSVPAREVGGDFFNYFAMADGHIALLVGDVAGKGVGAALLMANIQASLRTRFALGQELSAIADAIDRDIEANSPGPMYATLFVGILDPGTRRLRYVNAGHHPQYVLRMRGGLERMGATGLPAGLLAGRGYDEREVQLDAGDLIFFYTDGCPETENDREEMFGSDQLEALLAASHVTEAADILQRVETALREFRGSREPFDDATMMAVKIG
jgi:serine phosphatase RsbU (regulator of sigma subunit)